MSCRGKRKAAGKQNSAKEEAAEHQRVLGIEHEQRGRVKVEAEPEIKQRDRLTSGGDLPAVRTQRADEGAKPNEDVEHLEQQLRELASQKEEAHRTRDELLEIYCPGAISSKASTHQQQRQENRPVLTARRQLIKAKIEVDQAKRELESTVSWVNVIKKSHPAFKKRTIHQKPTTAEMRTTAMQVEKAIADDEESLRKARQSAGLQPITEEGAEDNRQPRDTLDDSEPNSEEGREPGGQ
ncbi:unnamed protein product [Ectocarpus fasciculatus]